jgi:ubiquinone/menaquinone biosynthesis C-methylase UbiE
MHEGHFDPKRAGLLDGEGRLNELRPQQLLRDVAGIGPGMACVDMGCGTGTFSLPAAALVGETGTIYAVDDSTEMLDHLRVRRPPPSLELVHSDAAKTGLADGIADVCLLAFILHEVSDASPLIAEAFRLLKPGGKALAIEWRSEPDSPGPPMEIRIAKAQVKGLFQKAGFSALEYAVWSSNHYWAKACKPTTPHR